MSAIGSRSSLNSTPAPPVQQQVPAMQMQEVIQQPIPYDDKDIMKKLGFYMVLTSFFLMWAFFYILFQAFNPWITQQGDNCYRDPCDKRPPDNGKCLVGGLIVSVIVFLFLWLILASLR